MPLQLAKISQHVYGYDAATDKQEVEHDARLLFKQAVPKRKLILIGGTHGYDPSGIPVRQTQAERTGNAVGAADAVVVAGTAVSSFALEDHDIRSMNRTINFTYKNIAKLCGSNGEIDPTKTNALVQSIRNYDFSGDWLILLTWCFSVNWARSAVL